MKKQGPTVITHPDGTKIVFVPVNEFTFIPIDLADGKPYNLLARMNVVGKGK